MVVVFGIDARALFGRGTSPWGNIARADGRRIDRDVGTFFCCQTPVEVSVLCSSSQAKR